MAELAQAGDFCPNKECRDYGKLQSKQAKRNITKYDKSSKGEKNDDETAESGQFCWQYKERIKSQSAFANFKQQLKQQLHFLGGMGNRMLSTC